MVVCLGDGGGVGVGVGAGAEADGGYDAVAVVVPASGEDVGEGSDRAVEAVGAYEEACCEGGGAGGESDMRVGGEI